MIAPAESSSRRKLHVVQLSFHADEQARDAEELLDAWPTLSGVAIAVARAGAHVTVVQPAARYQTVHRHGVEFRFVHEPTIQGAHERTRRYVPSAPPRRIMSTVVSLQPDVIHVQGLSSALAARRLAAVLPGVPLLVQDHASAPPGTLGALAWRWCYRSLDGVAVAARAQAEEFFAARALPANVPVFEVIEGSTGFTPGDQDAARRATGLTGHPCFLWTGHLDENKDPLTTLKAFGRAVADLPNARLWCCYTKAPLVEQVRSCLADTPELGERVTLLGRRPHAEMELLFRAADFFVQTSRREGCSYSAIEALACGATPLVTDIASNRRIVGDAGSLTPVGDVAAMAAAMTSWAARDRKQLRDQARARFDAALSYEVIGRELVAAYEALRSRP